MATQELLWIILLSPLVGFLIQSLLGSRIIGLAGKKICGALAVAPILISFSAGLLAALQVYQTGQNVIAQGPEWIAIQGFRLPFELLGDPLSLTMVLIIAGVGALIHIYATTYMADDRDYSRFFTYMNLFVAAMLMLVLGNNLALLFIGWEGVGLCSYLLIGFWYKELPNARAANKAFIVNRIGDWGLMLGLFLIVSVLVSKGAHIPDGRYLSYDAIEGPLLETLASKPYLATVIALLLFVGAAGKSAQFPLYLWLPDAMAGPTPVSALIHAATMVTSGVFLLNRMHYVFEVSPVASAVVCMVGAFTAAFAALVAFGQMDIKRVLAYSTVSQLGFMFIACGAGAYWAGMFHVATHAFFKALLFLGAGAVIYSMSHNQDMRNYGALRKYLPITCYTMCAAWLAISGFPLLAGYFSKEAILGSAFASTQGTVGSANLTPIAGWIGLGSAVLTAAYMTRLMTLTFFGKQERWREIPAETHAHGQEAHAAADESPALADDPHDFYAADPIDEEGEHTHDLDRDHSPKEAPISMTGVLIVLALLSIFGGLLNYNDAFRHWLYPNGPSFIKPVAAEAQSLPAPLWVLSAIAALGGILFGLIAYAKGLPKDQGFDDRKWKIWRLWEREQFGFDYFATTGAVEGGGEVARTLDRWFENGLIDRIVNGVGTTSTLVGRIFKTAQTGYVRLYALIMLLGGAAFIGYFVYAVAHFGGGR